MHIYVTRNIPEAGIQLLKKHHTLTLHEHNRPPTKKELISNIKNHQALLCLLTDPIDKDVITAEPTLKIIANYAVGYDNIDINTATQHKIPVTNTPGVLTDTTADLAWALVFAVSRRIIEADQFTRAGKFTGWEPLLFLGRDISNKTLGIIGTGRIGTAFALKSKGFNMPVLYSDIHPNPVLEKQLNAKKVPLTQLITQADIISIHVPLTPDTHHLITKTELQSMKETTILINTSRGPVIAEHDLITALQNNWIFGAGLDVFEQEPQIDPNLLALPNAVVLPHIGSASIETRSNMAIVAANNILAGLEDTQPPNCVNPGIYES